MQTSLPLALTMGDPAGIGLDIALSAWRQHHAEACRVPPFVMLADATALRSRAAACGWAEVVVETIDDPAQGWGIFQRALPVIDLPLAAPVRAGCADPANGPMVIEAIRRGVALVRGGHVSALVTNPIAKSVLYSCGFKHPGHTEYLAELGAEFYGIKAAPPVMLLAAAELRVVPLTVHIPLADVPDAISGDLIKSTVLCLDNALKVDFGIAHPRIAVAGLNPHAGEGGTIGRQDADIITPAVASLRSDGFDVRGPLSADTLFHAAARLTYDAVVAMYHDQALIPIKTLAFDRGVNITLGLPFVRTSPDHGTAFDIAGTGTASAESLIEALRQAQSMAAARRQQQRAGR